MQDEGIINMTEQATQNTAVIKVSKKPKAPVNIAPPEAKENWFCVNDGLPPDNTHKKGIYWVTYSEPFGSYALATFNPATGWRDLEGMHLKVVTHWLDKPILLPFEIRYALDKRKLIAWAGAEDL